MSYVDLRDQITFLGGLLTFVEHWRACFGGSAGSTPIYVAGQPGHCYVSISRKAADAIVKGIVMERLGRPDAADLFRTGHNDSAKESEIHKLLARRDDLAGLVADGLEPLQLTDELAGV